MKKANMAVLAAVLMAAASYAGAGEMKVDFDGGAPGAVAALKIDFAAGACKGVEPAVAFEASPAAGKSAVSRVQFEVREGFYGTNTMAAFDLASGARVLAAKYGSAWNTEVELNGVKETGKVEVFQQKLYTYTSGDSTLTMEVKNGAYKLAGDIAAALADGNAIHLDARPQALSEETSFSLKNEAGSLTFRRNAVSGSTGHPRLAGAVTALYLVMLRETPYGIARSVDFSKSVPSWDENGMGWVACSEKGQTWQSKEVEWFTEREQASEIYICKYEVTWDCRWKNCTVPYPHTDPGNCACKVSCNKSKRKIGECRWEQK